MSGDRDSEATVQEADVGVARYSLTGLLMSVALVAVGSAYVVTLGRLRSATMELEQLRREVGYLEKTSQEEIAAVRVTTDLPMTYRLRVRVPASPPYRLVYSSVWPADSSGPKWFGAVGVPPGESSLMVRVMKDPRDDQWKIATLRRNQETTQRMATVLPENQVELFRGSHDWLRVGIGKSTTTAEAGQSLRLLDERILAGEGATMLYGDRPPRDDMVGIYAELQPDVGPL